MIISITAHSFIYRLISSVECRYGGTYSVCRTYKGKFCLCHEGGLKYLPTQYICMGNGTNRLRSDIHYLICSQEGKVVRYRQPLHFSDSTSFNFYLCGRLLIYCQCYSSQWYPWLAATDTELIWDDSYATWNFIASQAVIFQTCIFPLW